MYKFLIFDLMFCITASISKNPGYLVNLSSSLPHFQIYLQKLMKCSKNENCMKKNHSVVSYKT